MTVSARAVGTLGPTKNCVYALSPSGTGIKIAGGAVVQLPGCGLVDDSSSSTAALQVTGTGTISASTIGVVGNYAQNGGAQVTPTATTGIASVSDPLAFLQPPSFSPSSCLADPQVKTTVTLGSSGTQVCYNGLTVNAGASVTFNPGVYIINGAFSISGSATATGAGVTFYLPSGASVSINGGVLNLTAPTSPSATYDGILFYQDRSNTTTADIEGGANSTLEGIFYFPDAGLKLAGGSSTSGSSQVYASVIASTLNFVGGSTINNYALVNPSTPLTTARLVE